MSRRRLTLIVIGVFMLTVTAPLIATDVVYLSSFGPAYNPGLQCTTPIKTTVESIIANQTFMSISNKRLTNPPCSSFVEIDQVVIAPGSIETGLPNVAELPGGNWDCAMFWTGLICDTTFDVISLSYSNFTGPIGVGTLHRIHVEIDKNWKASGIAPREIPTGCQYCVINIVGFVYFDPGHIFAPSHPGNGWEIHPLASWKCVSGSC